MRKICVSKQFETHIGAEMSKIRQKLGWGGAVLAVAVLALTPAFSAPGKLGPLKRIRLSSRSVFDTFTPASADPRLAAAFARSSIRTSGFRFTPVNSTRPSRALTVAVRTRTTVLPLTIDRPSRSVEPVGLGVEPGAYKLGAAVGWRNFALTGEVAQSDRGMLQGGRRTADVGVSYSQKRLTTRVQVETEAPLGNNSSIVARKNSVAVDFGGSYRLNRKIDLTAGVRYKAERSRDRIDVLPDNRRDSQAVYIGTQFRF
jgi:hypothetical protein